MTKIKNLGELIYKIREFVFEIYNNDVTWFVI